jgi:hypothetical protein
VVVREEEDLWELVESGMFGDPSLQILDTSAGEFASFEDERHSPTSGTPEITDEDYLEDEERIAFLTVRDQVRLCCNVNTKPTARESAVEWIFTPGLRNQYGLDFGLCCRALGARPHLIQIRTMYQLYARQIIFPKPLPFLANPLPELLGCEILYHYGDNELEAAKLVWLWPGIRADILLVKLSSLMTRRDAQAAMERLEERGYVALWSGFWWFTGRNPSLMSPTARSRFRWSEQIP